MDTLIGVLLILGLGLSSVLCLCLDDDYEDIEIEEKKTTK